MTNPYTARRRKRPKRHLAAIIAAITVALLAGYMLKVMASSKDDRDTAVTTEAIVPADIDLLYVRLPDGTDNSNLDYTGFRIGFNASMHEPNYAAWELDSARLDGAASRKDAKFQSDPDVDGCATLADYRNSGYDRGHMVPAADMKWDEQAMHDCHYLTNIAPQQQQLNTGAWNSLEGLCRQVRATRSGDRPGIDRRDYHLHRPVAGGCAEQVLQSSPCSRSGRADGYRLYHAQPLCRGRSASVGRHHRPG